MSKQHVYTFNTHNDYKTATRMKLPVPNVCFISETNKTYTNGVYNSYSSASAGDIVAFDNDGNRFFVNPFAWSGELRKNLSPEAVVVVPSKHAPEGVIRAMALSSLGHDSFAPNETNGQMVFGAVPNTDEIVKFNGVVSSLSNDSQQTTVLVNTALCTKGKPVDGVMPNNENNTPEDVDTYWENVVEGENLVPSPYLNNGEINEIFRTNLVSNALSDFNGKENTEILFDSLNETENQTINEGTDNLPIVSLSKRYSTAHFGEGTWYVPSAGEVGYMFSRLGVINYALNKVLFDGDESRFGEKAPIGTSVLPINEEMLWTSTAGEDSTLWAFNERGVLSRQNSVEEQLAARAFVHVSF